MNTLNRLSHFVLARVRLPALIFLAALPAQLARAATVQGDFVAHVIKVDAPPGTTYDSTHTITSAAAVATIPVGFTNINITTDSITVAVTAPSVTPIATLVGASAIEQFPPLDFMASGTALPLTTSVSGSFTMGNISSTPRLAFVEGSYFGPTAATKYAGRDAATGKPVPRVTTPIADFSTATVSVDGDASLEIAGIGTGASYGFPSTYVAAVQSFRVGYGFVANTSGDAYTTVTIHTIYSFRAPVPTQAEFLEVLKVVEDVEVKLPDGDWITPAVGMRLGQGARISTGPDSELHLLYPDSTVLVLKQMGEYLASTLIRQGNAYKAQILLKGGEISAQVNPAKIVTSDFSVATPVATASVRGTEFTVRHIETPLPKSFVVVKEGMVEVDPLAAGLATMMVGAGHMSAVTMTSTMAEPVPALSIARVPAGIRLTWPASATPVVLQKCTSLPAGEWAASGLPVTGEGNQNVTTAPATEPTAFFRLALILDQ